MLFKADHRMMICEGTKTETRRPDNGVRRPAKPGAVRGFYTTSARFGGRPFCRAEILTVEREMLGDIDEAGVRAEGYTSRAAFVGIWLEIWGPTAWDRDHRAEVWVVKFKLVEQLSCASCGGLQGSELIEIEHSKALFCRFCTEIQNALA